MPALPPRVARNPRSLPAQPGRCSFLTFPPEIRNKIYHIFVESDQPIPILSDLSWREKPKIDRDVFDFSQPLGFLLSCRTVHHELASSLYGNNTYWFAVARIGIFQPPPSVFAFVDLVGSQAHWLRNIIITLSAEESTAEGVFKEDLWGTAFEGCKELVDVTPYILGALQMGITPTVSLISEAEAPLWNAAAVNATIKKLLRDKQLKTYTPLIGAIGVNYNGSGGAIVWRRAQSLKVTDAPDNWDIDACHYLRFAADNDTNSLQWLLRQEPATWYCLPQGCRDEIFRLALYPGQTKKINLDTDIRFPFGAALVNKAAYEKFHHCALYFSSFELSMSTDELRSTFSGFIGFRRLLRKGYLQSVDFSKDSRITMLLDFKLSAGVALQDVRINILPLVLESSALSSHELVQIRIWKCADANESLVAENTVKLRKLRKNVAKALKSLLTHSHSDNRPIQIWIDGLGRVVDCSFEPSCSESEMLDMLATRVERVDASGFRIMEVHFIDSNYRYTQGFALEDRANCVLSDSSQLFPFTGSIWETYQFINWVRSRRSFFGYQGHWGWKELPVRCACPLGTCKF